ncbi:MAG TPA: RNA-guided endonuclease TnpB family protein, partial [Terriglobales bacterium]|nr:RNA-guided endonuclease TnpB family protein [Terriglobales bacterium]
MAKTIQCHKVYKFRMEPTELQGLELNRAAAVARFVYNWGLERCQEHYKQHRRGKPWNELSAELTQLKKTEPWLYDFDAQMLQQALADLRRAYMNFFAHRAAFPKFKKKKSARQSFRIPQRVVVKNGCVYVPSIGRVRIRQSQEIKGTTKSATFKRTAVGHWFVTLVVEFALPESKVAVREEEAIGFDLVLAPPNFLVGSDGSEVRAPRYYRAGQRKLRRAQRRLSRARPGSRNRARARLRVAQVHHRTANLRQEFLHQLSHWIVGSWSVLCFETLSLKSLARTKQAKSWRDAAFGELLRQVKYKALWHGKHFVQVGRYFPSTRRCSTCGYKNDALSLSERAWSCPGCGTQHARDGNAAKNIRCEGLRLVAEGHPETL